LGQLWIDADSETSITRAAEMWGKAITEGGDPKTARAP